MKTGTIVVTPVTFESHIFLPIKVSMLKYRLVFCFISFVLCAAGQPLDFTLQWGQEFAAPRRSSLADIVGHDGSGIYVIKERAGNLFSSGSELTLEHFGKKFEPQVSAELEISEEGRLCEIQYVLHLKNKLYLFYSLLDPQRKKNKLFVRTINKTTLRPEDDKRMIGEIDFSRGSKYNRGDFNFRVSRDSSKIAVFYALPNNDDEPQSLGFHVLDENLGSVWELQTKLPYQDDLFDVESYKVGNNGNVYLLGLIYEEKRKSKRKGLPNYRYEVLSYSDNGTTIKQYPISLADKFLTDMQIESIDNKNLICAGFYSAKGTFSIAGTFFLTIDLLTKEVKTKSFREFDLQFITQNMTEREAERTVKRDSKGDDAELYEYNLDKLLVGKDGSAILIGEQYFMKAVTSTMYINGRPSTTTTYHYYYNDIIAVKINPAGQIEWAEKVATTQHTTNDGGFYSSYLLAIVKNRICFIFNDHPDNLLYKGVGRPRNFFGRETLVMMVSLDQAGKQTRQPIFNSMDAEVITRPKVCEQISNNDIILFGQRRKTQQFARVSFR